MKFIRRLLLFILIILVVVGGIFYMNGKKLYDALFSNFEKGDNIKIDKDTSFCDDDKLSNAVYSNIIEVIEKIVTEINDFEEENVETNI